LAGQLRSPRSSPAGLRLTASKKGSGVSAALLP
jgi:hypothetical protein